MAPTTYDEPIELPGVEPTRSAIMDWEPIDVPNPVGWEPKSALTGFRPSA